MGYLIKNLAKLALVDMEDKYFVLLLFFLYFFFGYLILFVVKTWWAHSICEFFLAFVSVYMFLLLIQSEYYNILALIDYYNYDFDWWFFFFRDFPIKPLEYWCNIFYNFCFYGFYFYLFGFYLRYKMGKLK